MIDLYFWPTPNGHKISIFLEEAGLPYRIVPVDIGAGAQFDPSFLTISPNNRMPAIVDPEPEDGGAPISVFESGAILLYLARKIGRFIPSDLRGEVRVHEWLFWQVGNVGPMFGQAGHFKLYNPGKSEYAEERYTREVGRLVRVMNAQLGEMAKERGTEDAYLAGAYSIADMAVYPWVRRLDRYGHDWTALPAAKAWCDRLGAREAVKRGIAAGRDLRDPRAPLDAKARKILFEQK
jgi:GST-like protein